MAPKGGGARTAGASLPVLAAAAAALTCRTRRGHRPRSAALARRASRQGARPLPSSGDAEDGGGGSTALRSAAAGRTAMGAGEGEPTAPAPREPGGEPGAAVPRERGRG